jgi:hypothetical protein
MSGLVEYLYVDMRRLDSYVEQIRSPITYDKIPMWSAELSLSGPRASAAQSRQARPWTTSEKVQIFLDYLSSSKRLVSGTPFVFKDGGPLFCVQICHAFPILIPYQEQNPGLRGVRLWVSWRQHHVGDKSSDSYLLCLLEDDRSPDEPYSPGKLSPFSALAGLLGTAEPSGILDTVLAAEKSNLRFDSAPIDRLKELGATFGAVCEATVLYRVRSQGVQSVGEGQKHGLSTVIGYAILIAEGRLPSLDFEKIPRSIDVLLQ